jgi:hypothetical protein
VPPERTGSARETLINLTQEDFLLRDDGKPIELTRFNRGKDQTLRPVQLWLVLLCNEELHFPMGVQRRTEIEGTGFGMISKTAGTSRQIQFSLKLTY